MVETKVTAELLEKMGASCSQLERFKETWPDGVEITLENCLKAVRLDFDLNWFACRFLETNAWDEYEKTLATLWDEYLKVKVSAWAEYMNVKEFFSAWDSSQAVLDPEYHNVLAMFPTAYWKVLDLAREKLKKTLTPAEAEYQKAIVTAFYNAYLNELKHTN